MHLLEGVDRFLGRILIVLLYDNAVFFFREKRCLLIHSLGRCYSFDFKSVVIDFNWRSETCFLNFCCQIVISSPHCAIEKAGLKILVDGRQAIMMKKVGISVVTLVLRWATHLLTLETRFFDDLVKSCKAI